MDESVFDWSPTTNKPEFDWGLMISGLIMNLVKKQLPEFKVYFPFQDAFHFDYYAENEIAAFQIIHRDGGGMPAIGKMKDEKLIEIVKKVASEDSFPEYEKIKTEYPGLFSFEKLTVVSRHKDMSLNSKHIMEYIVAYLNDCVLPQVMDLNRKRVLSAIPTPPTYNIKKIIDNIYVIETPSLANQGTCFMLRDVGMVTCAHCIAEDSFVFRSTDMAKHYPVTILKKNDTIDLAIFNAVGLDQDNGLEVGNSDEMALNDHIAVAGFPNHNFGDSGIFSPGLIIGFRVVSSIRRLLLNTPLIGGNSGGPVVTKDDEVIGVAVTGAENMESANETENHGVIPIQALYLL